MFNFPRYLIFPDNVYVLSILYQSDVGRAMKRDLIDYFAEIKNPLESSDVRTVTLGISKSLVLGYRGEDSIAMAFRKVFMRSYPLKYASFIGWRGRRGFNF